MFLDTTAQKTQLAEIAETYADLVTEYGRDKAVYPLLAWLKDKQADNPYAISDNYVYLKLELELAHLIAEREIVAHTVQRSNKDVSTSLPYRQMTQKIESYILTYVGGQHEI